MKAFGFAAILVSVCAMAACTVTSTDNGTGGSGGEGGEGGAGTTTSSSGGGEGGEGGEGGGNECSGLELQACVDCCSEAHPSETEALTKLNYWHCGCVVTRCAEICNTTDTASDVCGEDGEVNLDVDNPNCDACVADESATGACYDDALADCADADDCKALTECSDVCE
ncbi:hypothetical protein WMF30_37620 [Sorangium sp. So ce134]